MMRSLTRRTVIAFTGFGFLGISFMGCSQSTPAEVSTELPLDRISVPADSPSSPVLLTAMPSGELTTPSAIKESGETPLSVVLGGRIDAGAADPFQPGELAFMVSQLPDEGHGENDPDHADNCPFCKRKLENAPRAIIQFKTPDGQVIKGDARQRFAIEKGDVVYVTGTAQYNAAVNVVMVSATGLYRKPVL